MGARFNCDQKMSISEFNPWGSYWIHYRGHTLCSGGDISPPPVIMRNSFNIYNLSINNGNNNYHNKLRYLIIGGTILCKKIHLSQRHLQRGSTLRRCFNEGRWLSFRFRKHRTRCSRRAVPWRQPWQLGAREAAFRCACSGAGASTRNLLAESLVRGPCCSPTRHLSFAL